MDIWQRGTSISSPSGYTADGWSFDANGTGATRTVSRQAFASGDLIIQEFGESNHYLRIADSVAGSGESYKALSSVLEDVRTLAKQKVTLSFWARTPSVETTYTVTNSGASAYLIDAVSNPTLSVVRGNRYIFDVNASGHPFWIQTSAGAYNSGNVYSDGVTNGGEDVGQIIWDVPLDAPNTLYYVCQFHSSMGGSITVSDPSTTVSPSYNQNFGTLGSTSVTASIGSAIPLTSSWTRFSRTFTLPEVSGKTIGADSFLAIDFNLPLNAIYTVDLWGVQLESGSIATPFKRSALTVAGEQALSERYYVRFTGASALNFGVGVSESTTVASVVIALPNTLRSAPTAVGFASLQVSDGVNGSTVTGLAIESAGTRTVSVEATVGSGLTQFRPVKLVANNNAAAFVEFSSELQNIQ
jgi:hypothetical protein